MDTPQKPEPRIFVTSEGGPGDYMPETCPNCGQVGTLVAVPQDLDELSEGQMADYLAGLRGVARCRHCGEQIEWRQ